jgi:hypothetical protein
MDNICELADQTVDSDNFRSIGPSDVPIAVLGCLIKNKYDQSRVKIREEYNPTNILHFISADGEVEPIYLHGIILDDLPILQTICDDIKMAPLLSHSLLESYDCIMRRHKLSCDTCYRYLADGIYPIDVKHLHRFSIKRYDDLHKLIKKGESLPWFSYWVHVGLFILNSPTMVQQAI